MPLNNHEIIEKLLDFAELTSEKYFEKPKDNKYWRQQLDTKFENNTLWFGNLYHYGGKSVKIVWDADLSYTIKMYHLPIDISKKIKEDFDLFIEAKM